MFDLDDEPLMSHWEKLFFWGSVILGALGILVAAAFWG